MLLLPQLGHLSYNKANFGNQATETPLPLKDSKGTIVYPGFPADVLFNFRFYSVAAQLILWTALGLIFAPSPNVSSTRRARTPVRRRRSRTPSRRNELFHLFYGERGDRCDHRARCVSHGLRATPTYSGIGSESPGCSPGSGCQRAASSMPGATSSSPSKKLVNSARDRTWAGVPPLR